MSGTLLVIGTPIGNLGDLSPRAAEAITGCDVVACEDSRRLSKLAIHLGIKMPKVILIESHRELSGADMVCEALDVGSKVGLVTDAGMPTISDPGSLVVERVISAGHKVDVMPGPTALSSAVAVSGFSSKKVLFLGFLDKKGAERASSLDLIAGFTGIVVLYESPKRISQTLDDLITLNGDSRPVLVARELTKLHQTLYRGTLRSVYKDLDSVDLKGEVTIVLGPVNEETETLTDDEIIESLQSAMAGGLSTRDAVTAIAQQHGIAKNRVYELANRVE